MIVRCFKTLKNKISMRLMCVKDVSDKHFEEVSCELQTSSNLEKHVDVTTTYLGRYMAQGGPRTFNSENVISLDGKGVTTGTCLIKQK